MTKASRCPITAQSRRPWRHALWPTPHRVVASTTKTVTAAVLVRLAEQGSVDLDAPVRRYLPDFELQDRYAAERVSVRQLLLHTAGWEGDIFADTGDGDDALARYVAGLREARQVTPLGAAWSYSNAAFCVAGRVVEAVTGDSYEASTRRLLLGPLGMRHTSFRPREVMLRRFAVGHVVGAGSVKTARPWPVPRSANAAGGLASSVRDQLRYARFHLGDGRAEDGPVVLTEASMRAMQAPQVAAERGFAFTSLTNADTGAHVNRALDGWVQEHLLGLAVAAPQPVAVPEADLVGCAGVYRAAGLGPSIEVRLEGDALRLDLDPGDVSAFTDTPADPPAPFRARFVARDRIRIADGPLTGVAYEFLRDDLGRIR